jgi:membrane protein implicated in regulation of membrane protease activity
VCRSKSSPDPDTVRTPIRCLAAGGTVAASPPAPTAVAARTPAASGTSSLAVVLFLAGVFLAIFVLPQPWGLVAIAVGAALDIAETGVFLSWSGRRKALVGVEALVGRRGVAVGDLWPEGQVRVGGEIWNARCEGFCNAGTEVAVREVDGLMLIVDPV